MPSYLVSLDPLKVSGAQLHPTLGVLFPGKSKRVRLSKGDAKALRSGGYDVVLDSNQRKPAPLMRLGGPPRRGTSREFYEPS